MKHQLNLRSARAAPGALDPNAVSLILLGFTSLSGGLTAAVTVAGRTAPATASFRWLAVFMGASLLLAAWGLLYAHLLSRGMGLRPSRALYLSVLCHLPLLLGLGLLQAVYTDDLANYVYSSSVYGEVLYRPLAMAWLVVLPALLQLLVAALLHRRWVAAHLAIAAPVAVALVLRVWSLNWQLPYLLHNDERTYISTAMMAWAHSDPNPHRFINPSVNFYLDTALFNLLGGSLTEKVRILLEAFGQRFYDPRGMALVTLASRTITALSGTATVALVYLSGKELFGKRAGLLAAWFLAVSFLHVRNSHYGTNDVSATFLAAASFLFAARLYRSGRWRDYLWAGALGGLATSTKYNAGIFIVPIFVAHIARWQRSGPRASLLRGTAPLILSYLVSALVFVLGTPYSILDWPAFISGFRAQMYYGSTVWGGQAALPTWWMHLAALVQGFGLLPLLLAGLAIPLLIRSEAPRLALATSFPAVYYAFMSTQQLYFARFSIPMLPFVAILAGSGADRLSGRLLTLPSGRVAATALLAIALAQPTVYSIRGDSVMAAEDTRVLADRWISANLPDRAALLVDDTAELRQSQGWPSRPDLNVRWYVPSKEPRPWEQEAQRPVYLATSSFAYDGMRLGKSAGTDELPDLYKPIEQVGHLVALFREGRDQKGVDYSIDDTFTPFWHLWDRERPGPTVRIYRLD